MIRPLWIEVDLKILRQNLRTIRAHLGRGIKIVATIKQSAYGHGLIPLARELALEGVDFFGVGSIEEAITLREDGFSGSVIILSAVLNSFADFFVKYNVIPTLVDIDFAKKLNIAAAKKDKIIRVHIKIDTGMGRLGIYYKEAYAFIKKVNKLKNLFLEGIYTHFPVADTDSEFTNYQIGVFNQFIQQLRSEKISFKFHHCANSIGITNYPNAHFNMVRPGLILYGIKPSHNIKLDLEPILCLKSKVIFVKKIQKGMSVSYGRTYIADKPRNIATVAVGYADGYPWNLSNRAKVIIADTFFEVVGRVCMDHIMVDLKDREDIKPGEEVILIGSAKNNKISVESIADIAGTIPYEIVSRLSLKIPRIYKHGKKENT